MKMYVIVRTSFTATHSWLGCNIDFVSYLKNEHRHVFYVEAKALINHANRDIEFICLKDKIDKHLSYYENKLGNMSCENVALELLAYMPELYSVKIFEDNENGCQIDRE